MTLHEAERRGVDLSRFHAGHLAASHPFALAALTKIVKPSRRADADADSEILTGEAVPFDLWPHQREIIEAALKRRRIIILKARQLGVTWTMALFALWYAFAHPGSEIVIVSIGEREARSFGRRIQWLYNHLPEQARAAFPAPAPTLEVFSVRHADDITSRITSLPSSSTAGRGETVNLLLLDEGAHWEDAGSRLASLLPTVEDIGQLIFASTANGIGDPFQETWEGAPSNGYHRIFANAVARPDRTEKSVAQARARVPDGKGPQEYPMTPAEAFLSSGKCAFSTRHLQEYLDHVCKPPRLRGVLDIDQDPLLDDDGQVVRYRNKIVFRRDDMNGPWRIWRWREEGRRYLIVGDPCGGGGGTDFGAMAVYDLDSWEQVAAFHGRPEPTEFATLMIRAGWRWRSGDGVPALLAPETNLDGRAVMAILREREYPNVWAMQTYDQHRDERTMQMGWATSARTRPIMLGALKEQIRDGGLVIRDNLAIGEMLTFEVNPKTGKEEAREGKHDDRVMTHAIAAVVLGREASDVAPRSQDPSDLQPYRQPRSSRTGY